MSESKIELVSRRVIEDKLLEALTDESVVAALFREQDLHDLIDALNGKPPHDVAQMTRQEEMARDLEKLLLAAFGVMGMKVRTDPKLKPGELRLEQG